MTEYTPYFPKPHQQTLNPIQIVQYANRDLLSIWSESNFQAKLMGIRVLNQAFFIANCPDAVEHILVTHQNNYQKKAAFIDKILHPLIANSSLLNPDIDQQRFQWLENKLFSNQSDNLLSIGIAKFEQSLLNWKQKEFPCQIQIVAELKKFYLNYVYQVLLKP
jgi:predicted MPP superfamily phosphohydrolase